MAADTAAALQAKPEDSAVSAPVQLGRILVALDQSDYANRAMTEAARLCATSQGVITGIHVYAARLHDRRFKQMEGGLPERYRRETEMEHQRDVHEDLIGMGLGLISDSYHNAAAEISEAHGVVFERLSPEGKNYSKLMEAMQKDSFDVLAMGGLGLGAVAGSTIGTVCERVVRRSPIDVFVAKDRHMALGDGPIVVAMDGSPKSFGGLRTAMDIGRRLDIKVHVVAAYDPYYHYVAFNKISTVLDEEAGKVFRFKEQEQLHEELIDDGIAKIYQAHLNVAQTVADEAGFAINTELVAGKPYQALRKYVEKVEASLLVVGKTGVHADDELDIGGNAENLLRMAPCHVWIGQAEFVPPMDVVAEETIMWSDEAEAKIGRAPDFVRGIARTSVIRKAQEQGHTFITTRFVDDVMAAMMPGAAPGAETGGARPTFERLDWSEAARGLMKNVADETVRDNIGLRAEKSARRDASAQVLPEHVLPFLEDVGEAPAATMITWRAAPLARLNRVPESFRAQVKASVETYVLAMGESVVQGDLAEAAFVEARKGMCPVDHKADQEEGDT